MSDENEEKYIIRSHAFGYNFPELTTHLLVPTIFYKVMN